MDIKNLPGASTGFKVSGTGQFSQKLKSATRYGGLRNLSGKTDAISGVIKGYESTIRRGGLSGQQKAKVLKEIQSKGDFSKKDVKDVKKILDQFGKEQFKEAKKASFESKKGERGFFSKTFGSKIDIKEVELTEAQKRRNIVMGKMSAEKTGDGEWNPYAKRKQKAMDKNESKYVKSENTGWQKANTGFVGGKPSGPSFVGGNKSSSGSGNGGSQGSTGFGGGFKGGGVVGGSGGGGGARPLGL